MVAMAKRPAVQREALGWAALVSSVDPAESIPYPIGW